MSKSAVGDVRGWRLRVDAINLRVRFEEVRVKKCNSSGNGIVTRVWKKC
jgi:hypothetical protein